MLKLSRSELESLLVSLGISPREVNYTTTGHTYSMFQKAEMWDEAGEKRDAEADGAKIFEGKSAIKEELFQ